MTTILLKNAKSSRENTRLIRSSQLSGIVLSVVHLRMGGKLNFSVFQDYCCHPPRVGIKESLDTKLDDP